MLATQYIDLLRARTADKGVKGKGGITREQASPVAGSCYCTAKATWPVTEGAGKVISSFSSEVYFYLEA